LPAAFTTHRTCLIVVLSIVLGTGHWAFGTCWAGEIVTLTGDPWPPYVIGEIGKEATGGTAVELVKQIFEFLPNTDVVFPMIPWNRALMEVKNGSMDGIAILLKTPERERSLDYTEPLFKSYSLVWYSTEKFPDGFSWLTLSDLSSYSIGITRGYSYGDQIDDAIASGELAVTPVPTVKHLFTMLARERVDIALAGDAVGHDLAAGISATATIRAAEKPTGTDVYHLAFSKRSPARKLIPQINQAIAEMREQGFIEQIISGGVPESED
jgi:ABC-type amino acid transport substrate-binding protein